MRLSREVARQMIRGPLRRSRLWRLWRLHTLVTAVVGPVDGGRVAVTVVRLAVRWMAAAWEVWMLVEAVPAVRTSPIMSWMSVAGECGTTPPHRGRRSRRAPTALILCPPHLHSAASLNTDELVKVLLRGAIHTLRHARVVVFATAHTRLTFTCVEAGGGHLHPWHVRGQGVVMEALVAAVVVRSVDEVAHLHVPSPITHARRCTRQSAA